jgi:Xaa-Pro aminopeptidase
MGEVHAKRIKGVAERLDGAGVDAFLTNDPISMGYLHGFREGSHERFMVLAISSRGDVRLICPALSESQARRSGLTDVRTWRDGEDPMAHFVTLIEDWDLDTGIVAVDPSFPARHLLKIQHQLVAALFRDGEEFLAGVMRCKDEAEIALMRRAGRIADEAFEEVAPQLREGVTEREVERRLVEAMADRGGKTEFCIVAAGANGAEPHHLTDETPLRRGDVVILDFGCDVEGYKSDITRVVAVGEASDRAREMYDLVYRAHRAGREAIYPGNPASDVDRAARGVIEAAGFGEAFFHRTGHGIGTSVHEAPYITAQSADPLEVGNCFSVEPGVYFPGQFGVRIENIVAVTASGHESMNAEPSPSLRIIP